jgi:hypothetical protein
MTKRYMDMFAEIKGVPSHKMSLMRPWEVNEDFNLKKPIIGIFQRGKYEGKGFHRMMDLATYPIAKNFNWLFVGNDWEPVVKKMTENGVDSTCFPDNQASYPEDYAYWYKRCDHVLIPSKWEGGPISALEAAAQGLDIISADVGWVKELLPYAKIFSDPIGLLEILNRISCNLSSRRACVDTFSYERCASQIVKVAEAL